MAGMTETSANIGAAMGMAQMGIAQPNFYELSGPGVSIRYTAVGHWVLAPFPSHMVPPQLQYQDNQVTRTFTGQEIRSQEMEIGNLVTVTIQMSIDSGATTATIILPVINMNNQSQVPFRTFLIWTRHAGPVVPVGQPVRETYNVVPLSGTARRIFFPL
ncbi:MAG TPA: hypothetical protein VN455_05490 [Methanotrichaceae archaeon]|nr:hypothetical protein [Methanotrichaceae archaeon]